MGMGSKSEHEIHLYFHIHLSTSLKAALCSILTCILTANCRMRLGGECSTWGVWSHLDFGASQNFGLEIPSLYYSSLVNGHLSFFSYEVYK